MKKILATLLVLTFAANAYAATTYTEQMVNKWVAPISQKEKQLQQQREAAAKAQKERQEAQRQKQLEQQRIQEQRKKDLEAAKKAHEKKMEEKKKAFETLLK